ncbi:MAG: TnpV protein [Lachnospiraceae bacterium]|nr:TnpV protein [Lachnospiraceae bacterium]MBQ8527806.1 TnpV protein [Lachnospiraceae bacterium]
MSNEISLFEKLGGTYTEVDGILYSDIGMDDTDTKSDMDLVVTSADIGKYGHLWISYMKENHPDRYRHHIRMGQILIKAKEVNEEAYEMFNRIVEKYLTKHKLKDTHSTMEMWKLREQAKQFAEEVIYGEIVYKYH